MCSRKKAVASRRQGVSVLLVAAMSIVVFPMVGLSVDVGILYLTRTKLSAATDAAALAGGRALRRGADVATQATNAQATAANYFHANFPDDFPLAPHATITTAVSQVSANVRQVVSTASVQVPISFLRVLPNLGPTITIGASATAVRRDVNLMLVLDRSGSLAASNSCDPMKAAAAGFVNTFSEQRDYLGLTTFATSSYYLDYALATNFKSASPSLVTKINSISCLGTTSSAMGLWNAYTALANLGQPGAMNIIVFFTDGQPTALTGSFPIKATSTCTFDKPPYPPNTPKRGVLSVAFIDSTPVVRRGLYQTTNGTVPISPSDDVKLPGDTTCTFYGNQALVANDVQYIPNQDYYGDKTNSGYQSVSSDGAGHVATDITSIINASINAADEAAKHIRNGDAVTAVSTGAPAGAVGKSLSNVVIFSIGLGNAIDAPPNAAFLKRVANDPGSAIFDSTKPAGLYVFAQTASDLNDAFQRVASEITRLAK